MNKIKYVGAVLIAIAGFGLQQAKAYTITLEQVGANVVANGSGAIDLEGLFPPTLFSLSPAQVLPSAGIILTGQSNVNIPGYQGFTGPSNFGPGDRRAADTSSGDFVGINNGLPFPVIFVPAGYVSNTALSDSMTFDNQTLGSLGLRPGTYVWTWGTGLPNQNFTVKIVPDGGTTVMLLGVALGVLHMARRFIMS